MSGTGDLPKKLPCNREEQILLKAIGVEFEQRIPVSYITSPLTLTGLQYLADLIFTAATANAITGPSAADLMSAMAQQGPVLPNSRFTQIIQNTDPTNAKTITFGANMNGGPVVIPAGSTAEVSWEVTSQNPPTFTLFQNATTGGGGAIPVIQFVGSQGLTQTGPIITTTAGDYTASEITNVPAGNISSVNVQAALNELDQEKVTLRNLAGAVGTGAAQAGDILVSIAAGDQYVPSGITANRPGHIGSMEVGALAGATAQTVGGAAIEAFANGAVPLFGVGRFVMGATHNPSQNYSVVLGDASANVGAPGFGQDALQAQSVFRAILPAGLPGATNGLAGAYVFSYDNGALKLFFVNSLGNLRAVPTALAGATQCNFDANSMLTSQAIPSSREVKENIEDAKDSSWILKAKPRTFQYRDEKFKPHSRAGLIIEELQDAKAPYEAFVYNQDWKDGETVGRQKKPAGICWDGVTAALIAEVQKLRIEMDQLKAKK